MWGSWQAASSTGDVFILWNLGMERLFFKASDVMFL
jgi:hypothetical protein